MQLRMQGLTAGYQLSASLAMTMMIKIYRGARAQAELRKSRTSPLPRRFHECSW